MPRRFFSPSRRQTVAVLAPPRSSRSTLAYFPPVLPPSPLRIEMVRSFSYPRQSHVLGEVARRVDVVIDPRLTEA